MEHKRPPVQFPFSERVRRALGSALGKRPETNGRIVFDESCRGRILPENASLYRAYAEAHDLDLTMSILTDEEYRERHPDERL